MMELQAHQVQLAQQEPLALAGQVGVMGRRVRPARQGQPAHRARLARLVPQELLAPLAQPAKASPLAVPPAKS